MTSNLGAHYLLKGVRDGKITDEARKMVMNEVKDHFRPEFLNRLDAITLFSPLSHKDLSRIITQQLELISRRLKDKNIDVLLDEKASELILSQAYDPVYGARPLRRYLEKHIVTQLSKLIIGGNLNNNSVVHISSDNDSLTYDIKSVQPPTKKQRNAY